MGNDKVVRENGAFKVTRPVNETPGFMQKKKPNRRQLDGEIARLSKASDALTLHVAQLIQVIREYGDHKDSCSVVQPEMAVGATCDCGWAKVEPLLQEDEVGTP